MKKKVMFSLILASLLAAGLVFQALAGATYEIGQLAGSPPLGEANWTAWQNKNVQAGGMPSEIMTEDNTNSDSGTNGGYLDVSGVMKWLLQVENFSNEINGDVVSMIFGGLISNSGKLWNYSFTWDQTTGSTTDHGTIPLSVTTRACPSITHTTANGSTKTITFNAEASKTYHVYKSTQGSGTENGASNGRYLFLKSATTDSTGTGSFSDTEPLQSWYIVIPANSSSGALDGCHSEEAGPTAVTVDSFDAQVSTDSQVVTVTWSTASEVYVLGFNLYRTVGTDPARQKLNSGMIYAKLPGDLHGAVYDFPDTNVEPGKKYTYWLEVVKNQGDPEEVGPLAVVTGYKLFMPSLKRNR